VISDSGMFAPDMPTIGASLRGLAYFEIRVRAARSDLHSGSYGGAVANPATALARIIASFHDDDGHILVPGFYDDVRTAPEFVEQIRTLPFEDQTLIEETGVPELFGEKGYTTLERLWVRPTCEVNGLLSGYTGEGAKTVLPSHAMAKVSCRLVPDQDPAEDRTAGRAACAQCHAARRGPSKSCTCTAASRGAHARGAPVRGGCPRTGRGVRRDVIYAGEGGSIPIVSDFERVLGAPVLLMGFGLPGENAHAPDEWMSVENYEKGTRAAALLLERARLICRMNACR
jgi:acetylornithine deacetylase/succinyl-diaminopimelate desuccinylase-like protein